MNATRRLVWLAMLAALVAASVARAADETPPLEEVLVIGSQPGPGLWKVTRPDDPAGHVLWIFGNYSPLPKHMTWRSTELETVLRESQTLLAPPEVDASLGPLGGITLLPSALGVRKIPDGKRLADVVPPAQYVRWAALKARYLPNDDDVERWRPIFAAQALYQAVLDRAGLVPYEGVWAGVKKLARKADVDITTPTVEVDVDRPRDMIREFKRAPLDDTRCFARTLDRVEADAGLMHQRAAAWAVGDVGRLRALAPVERASACIGAVLESGVMQQRGYDRLPQQLERAWLQAAERALAEHRSTVAVLPVDEMLKADGYGARLKQAGYQVDDP